MAASIGYMAQDASAYSPPEGLPHNLLHSQVVHVHSTALAVDMHVHVRWDAACSCAQPQAHLLLPFSPLPQTG